MIVEISKHYFRHPYYTLGVSDNLSEYLSDRYNIKFESKKLDGGMGG